MQGISGTLGDDIITGTPQSDVGQTFTGSDIVTGLAADDVVNANQGNDVIFGQEGDDTLRGGKNTDALRGGKGDDELFGDRGDDIIYGLEGNDTVYGGRGSVIPVGNERDRDLLLGNQGEDVIFGNEGDDTIFGGKNKDVVFGGKDNDWVYGDRDDDTIYGNLGDDTILGGVIDPDLGDPGGRALIFGNQGNDVINGNEGNDTIFGGQDNDVLFGGQQNDLVYGDLGSDTIYGNKGDDSLLGATREPETGINDINDLIFGNTGADFINGNRGDDTIFSGQQNDLAYGGKENDLIYGDRGDDTLSGDLGDDTLFGGVGDPELGDAAGRDFLQGGEGNDYLNGNENSDILAGNNGCDIVRGGKGNDVIFGNECNDALFGDLGADTVTGGSGNDVFVIGKLTGGAALIDADIITDFGTGSDLIGLTEEQTFANLRIFQGTGEKAANTIIQDQTNNQYLAILVGVNAATLTADKFTTNLIPECDCDDEQPSPTPSPVPTPVPAPTPAPSPEPTPSPSPEPTPSPSFPPFPTNTAPTDISLSDNVVNENSPTGTVIGSLTTLDPDAGDIHTYELVDDAGGRFVIEDDQLKVADGNLIDFETDPDLTVTVRTTDSAGNTFEKPLAIAVNDTDEAQPNNRPPTDIALSNNIVNENSPAGTIIGSLSTTDPDAGDTHTYELVDDGDGRFVIEDNQLKVAEGSVIDFETTPTIPVTIRTTDSAGNVFSEEIPITVNDIDETQPPTNNAPTDLALSETTVDENSPAGTVIGDLSTTDPDSGDTHTYQLVDDADGRFVIEDNQLKVAEGSVIDFESTPTIPVTIRTTDSAGNTFDKEIPITVNDLDETQPPPPNNAPTDIALSNNIVNENSPAGTVIGSLSTTDPDPEDTHTYELVDDGDGRFVIEDNQLKVAEGSVIDFETTPTIPVTIRTTDSAGNVLSEEIPITVNDIDETQPPTNTAPTDLALSETSVDENSPAGTVIGDLSTTDPDTGDTHTYQLVDDADGRFVIEDNQLKVAEGSVIDFESTPTIPVTIRTTDSAGNTFDKEIPITVNDLDETQPPPPNNAPTDIALSETTVDENSPTGTIIGDLSTTDPDTGDTHTYQLVDDADGRFVIEDNQLKVAEGSVIDFESTPTIPVTIRTTDSAGNTFDKVIPITVNDLDETQPPPPNNAPTVGNPIANQTATEDTPFNFIVPANTFNDPDGDRLTYTATLPNGDPLPEWLDFDPATGTFSGTPAQGNVGTVSVQVTANDGNGGTVSEDFDITVGNVNDPPTLTNISKTGNEDSAIAFTPADFTNAFSDIEGDTLTKIQITALPTNGTLRLGDTPVTANQEIPVSALDTLTFTPAANFSGDTSFGWNGFDGTEYAQTPATVNLAVTPENDAPTVSAIAPQTTDEDVPLTNLPVTIGDAETPAANLTITATAADPALIPAGNITLGGTGSDRTLSITPAPNASGSTTITLEVSDGTTTTTETFDLTVNPVNDPPQLDLNGAAPGINYAETFTQNGGAIPIVDTTNLTLSDIDNPNIPSATVTITNPVDGANEILNAVTDGTNITANYQEGVLTLSGNDTLANYQKVLRSVAYNNTAANPNVSDRAIEFVVNDGTNNSAVATTTLSINQVADLALVKTVDNPTPTIGDPLTYTLTLTNQGSLAATNIQVTDSLPNWLDGITFTEATGVFNTAESVWTIPSLAGGASTTLTISGTLVRWGTIPNRAQVSFLEQEDPDSTPNNFISDEDDFGFAQAQLDLPPESELSNTSAGLGGFALYGVDPGDNAGRSVSSAGDVNGDGFDDLMIGTRYGDGENNATPGAGDSYIVFGGLDLVENIDLAALDGTNGFTVYGIDNNDFSGRTISNAGDINGDGFDDVIIASRYADGLNNATPDSGETYVVFGRENFAPTLNLASLNGTNGFTIYGIDAQDFSGRSISSAGDVNGDGFDDLIIGAYRADGRNNATPNAGEAYVIFGGDTFNPSLNLSDLDGTQGFTLYGIDPEDQTGRSVNSAGDINGDGFDDVFIGAYAGDGENNATANAGESYVVFGGNNLGGSIDLASLDGNNGFTLYGIDANDVSGRAVSIAGDLNGDGFDDLIIGAQDADGLNNASPDAGEAYVVFGSNNMGASIDLANLDGTNGFTIYGLDAGDVAGRSVSNAGDINGDGLDDIVVNAPQADGLNDANSDAGDTYIIFGSRSFGATFDVANPDGSGGFTLHGVDVGDRSGRSVSAGDINGDGFDDLLIGAPSGDAVDNAKPNAGNNYVFYGGDFTQSVTQHGGLGRDRFVGTAGIDVLLGAQDDDTLIGGGGADVLIGGEGNDLIAISDVTFDRIRGGSGEDTLRLDGENITLDLTTIPDKQIKGIERIDLNGSGNNLVFSPIDIRYLSDTTNRLIVEGVTGNSVTSSAGWVAAGTTTLNGNTYNAYNLPEAQLLIDEAITQAIA